jgi:hypothetical protein
MTVRGQVVRAELVTTGAGVKGQVLRAELLSMESSEQVRGQVIRAELFSVDVAAIVRGRVVRAELFTTESNATAVSPPGSVPSHSKVTLAAAYNGPDPTPDYEWQQYSGPSVTLTPNDALATCVVTIPALWAPATIVIQVRVAESTGATAWATCTLTADRHRVWQYQADGLDHPLGAWTVMDMPGTPEVPPDPNPTDPPVPPTGTPTEGLWFTALAPGYGGDGAFKSMPHFYPPFPISVSNEAEPSYWVTKWLIPAVEGQTDHRVYGGYVRDRPYDKYLGARPQPTGWQLNDAKQNVEQAALYGLDGFYLEMLGTLSSANNVRNLAIRDAANALYPSGQFKTTPMPDFNSPPINAMTADQLADLLAPFAVTNPTPGLGSYTRQPSAWYLPDNRFVWSCFRGDVATGGSLTAWPASRFTAVFNSLSSRYGISSAFIIGVNDYTKAVNYQGTGFYGFNQWGSGADPAVVRGMTNLTALAHTRSQVYVQSVWPSDMRPYQANAVYDDNYNTETVRAHGDRMISDGADGAQLATWSDYSEGGMWQRTIGRGRVLQKLYAWYAYKRKTGAFPTILRDVAILSHRNQLFPTGSTYRYDASGFYTRKMTHWDRGGNTSPDRNNVEVLTFLYAPAAVTLRVGSTTVTYTAPAGMYAHALTPLQTGTVSVDLKRSGVTIAAITSPFTVTNNPFNQNPMYYMMDSLDGVTGQYDPVETANP